MEKEILRLLVDKYEKSKHFLDADSNRRVLLHAKDVKSYQSNHYQDKESMHRAVEKLKGLGYIDYQWMRFEEGNLLDRLFLNLDALEEVYVFLHRQPLSDKVNMGIEDLEKLNSTLSWVQTYKRDMLKCLVQERSFHKLLPIDPEKRRLLLQVLAALDDITESTERLFSTRILGDSKTFERQLRSRLISIMRTYVNEEWEDDQLLSSVGILRNYDELLLKGKIKILLDSKWLDLSSYSYGTSLNPETIRRLEQVDVMCNKVVTIENKAVYYEAIKNSPDDVLVIYLGGFFGKTTKRFLQILCRSKENLLFSHWGDIDLGGFMIYDTVKEIVGDRLTPLHMDRNTLVSNRDRTMNFEQPYKKKLNRYLEKNPDSEFVEVVQYMLENEVRLEQEVLV